MSRMLSTVLMLGVLANSAYAAKPGRPKKEKLNNNAVQAVPVVADDSDVRTMELALEKAHVLARAITEKENVLAQDDVVRAQLKHKITSAFSQVLSLFTSGTSKLTDVFTWLTTLTTGVTGPNGQQLIADCAAVQAELAKTVEILDQLAKDPSLGLKGAADSFKKALQAMIDHDAKNAVLLQQSATFAACAKESFELLTALLVKADVFTENVVKDYEAAQVDQGTWVLLGGLLQV